jgi:membrane-bound inhibitor of C-type lysozyme
MCGVGGVARADTKPPMNDFNEAFYVCEGDHNFLISYDSDTPTAATMTTNGQKTYALKRSETANGVTFTGDGAKFWTDGKTTTVEGTAVRFQDCKRKTS